MFSFSTYYSVEKSDVRSLFANWVSLRTMFVAVNSFVITELNLDCSYDLRSSFTAFSIFLVNFAYN